MAQSVSERSSSKIDVKILVNDGKSYTIEKFNIGLTVEQFIKEVNRVTDLKVSLKSYQIKYVCKYS